MAEFIRLIFQPAAQGILLAGVLLSVLATGIAARQEGERRLLQFQRENSALVDAVDLSLRKLSGELAVLQQLFQILPPPRQQGFSDLASPFLKHNPAVRAIEWVPRVPRPEVAEFTRLATAELGTGYTVWERRGEGQGQGQGQKQAVAPAGPREDYFPVRYVAPMQGNLPALGFDLGSEPARRAALEQARRTASPRMTSPVSLVQENGRLGYLLFLPVQQAPGATADLRGLLLAVIDPERLLAGALANSAVRDLHFGLVDLPADGGESMVAAFRGDRFDAAKVAEHPLAYSRRIHFAGRELDVRVVGQEDAAAVYLATGPISIFLMCLTATLGFFVVFLLLRRQNQRIATEVERQSMALKATAARAERILDASPAPTLLVDQRGRIVDANQAAVEFFGYGHDELLQLGVDMLIPRRYRDGHAANREKYRQSPNKRLMDAGRTLHALHKDGRELPVSIGLSPLADGKDALTIACLLDLSEPLAHARQIQAERDQRQRYLDSMRSLLLELDVDGTVLLINQFACILMGRSREEMLGRNWFALALPQPAGLEEHYPMFRQCAEILTGGSNFAAEYPILGQDGGVYQISWTKNLLCDATGRVTSVLCSGHDVTERRLNERKILQLQREQEATLRALPDQLFELTAEGRYVRWYNRARRGGAGGTDTLAGKWLEDVLPAATAAGVRDVIQAASSAGVAHGREIELPVEGEVRHFEVSCARKDHEDGQPATFILLSRDVTERVRAESELQDYRNNLEAMVEARGGALRAAQEQLAAILNANPAPILVVDTQGKCTHWNAACERLFDIPAQEMVGTDRQWRAFYDSPRPIMADLIAQGREDELDTWYSGSVARSGFAVDGHESEIYLPDLDKWLQVTAAPLFDAGGQRIGAVETLLDVTARKRSEAEAIAARLTAEAASRAKSTFLANMSHEIRTPMNAIVGFTHMLRRDEVTPTQSERLGRIASAADHLLAVINDILDISKIEAGKLQLETIEFELDCMLRRVCSIIALRAQAKGVELVMDVSGLPEQLNGDPTRLSQALINYLGNAVKFTDKGVIILRGRLVEENEHDVLVRFEVEDSGIGIAAEHLGHMFAAFEQADDSMTRRYGGTGLGLAITKHIAHMMQGEVGVTSTPGVGSTFWLTARLGKSAQSPRETLRRTLHARQRVLVADDLAITQMVHSQLLRQQGLDPIAVATGHEAVTAIQVADAENDPFAIAFIDLNMPDMDGIATLQAIQALALRQMPLCVLVTASGDFDVIEHARAAGYADVLAKPVSATMLREWLHAHLGPLPARPAVAEDSVETVLARDFAGADILLVEDEPINQMIAQDMLEQFGFVVTIADNGQAAIAHVAERDFDLILTDMQMPVMDGLEATRRIRQLPFGQEVPVIAMTANAFSEDRANCLAAGMNDFVSKPVVPENFFSTLLKWLTVRRQQRAAGKS